MARARETDQTGESSAGRLLEEIRRRFPVVAEYLPLISGIEDEIGRHFPDVPNWRVIAALRRHVNDTRYLKAILRNEQRFNLLGDPAGEVTEGERAHAMERLEKLGASTEVNEDDGGGDALEDIRHGQRLMLCKLARARFGEDVVRRGRPLLNQLGEEGQLEEVGVALLDSFEGEEWLQLLADRVPQA